MSDLTVKKALLPWWIAGLLLGLVQVFAVYMVKPLGVSTQFVVADARILHKAAPEYADRHPLISKEKYRKFGYGWWLDIGLILGALIAAIATRRWKLQNTTIWWETNHSGSLAARFACGFFGGILIILGARFAHGCTSGQFASGWAQLSVSALPFTVALFAAGMLTARLIYPKTPQIHK